MTMSVEDVAKNEERKKMRQRHYDQVTKRRSTPEVGAVSVFLLYLGKFVKKHFEKYVRKTAPCCKFIYYIHFFSHLVTARKNIHCKCQNSCVEYRI